tara:strand:- start:24577 stop:24708 length:132 start_codon:yes stop_codon:yes gene_type:complete
MTKKRVPRAKREVVNSLSKKETKKNKKLSNKRVRRVNLLGENL